MEPHALSYLSNAIETFIQAAFLPALVVTGVAFLAVWVLEFRAYAQRLLDSKPEAAKRGRPDRLAGTARS